jgi:hypothetical protein
MRKAKLLRDSPRSESRLQHLPAAQSNIERYWLLKPHRLERRVQVDVDLPYWVVVRSKKFGRFTRSYHQDVTGHGGPLLSPREIAIAVPTIASKTALPNETHRSHNPRISRIPNDVSQTVAESGAFAVYLISVTLHLCRVAGPWRSTVFLRCKPSSTNDSGLLMALRDVVCRRVQEIVRRVDCQY